MTLAPVAAKVDSKVPDQNGHLVLNKIFSAKLEFVHLMACTL